MDRRTAIAEHRKMWNWIADTAKKEGRFVAKEEYLDAFGYDSQTLVCGCFCCTYSSSIEKFACDCCPLIWCEEQAKWLKEAKEPITSAHTVFCSLEGSPFKIYVKFFPNISGNKTLGKRELDEFVKNARAIAELPENFMGSSQE